jgi:hypothetical protein
MLAAIQASSLIPALFVSGQFANSTLYMWTGIGNIVWNGQTWTGIGTFGGASVIEEGATVEAKGITLTLSGIDPTALADVLQEVQLGLPVVVYLGLFSGTPTAANLIATPLTSWAGRLDQPTIDVDGTGARISIACESRLMEMNVPADRRLTQDDLLLVTPGDLGLIYQTAIQELSIYWGTTPTSTTNV